jgi:S-DNA-T family DNA segregation ATPase FtsK/SpoIIIE
VSDEHEVIEGEVVEPTPDPSDDIEVTPEPMPDAAKALAVRPAGQLAVVQISPQEVRGWLVQTARPAVVKGTRGTAKAAGKVVRPPARGAYRLGAGHVRWASRAVGAWTHRTLREGIEAAIRDKQHDVVLALQKELEQARNGRSKRLQALPRVIAGVAIAAAAVAAVLVVVFLGVVPLAIQLTPGGATGGDYYRGLVDLVLLGGTVIEYTAIAALYAAPFVWVATAYREGKKSPLPRWAFSPEQRAQFGAEVNEATIVRALARMGIASLKRSIEAEELVEFLVTPRAQGGGTYAKFRLPLGTTAAELLPSTRVELLAGNLGHPKHDCWPERGKDGADARVVDLWVADVGTMDRPAPPWPFLVEDAQFDVCSDRLPLGVTMRGEPVELSMWEKHHLTGATSNMGKTWFERLKALGLALDPVVELRIADLKGGKDWAMFQPRCHTLIRGGGEDEVEATMDMLDDVLTEMHRRYDELKRRGWVYDKKLARRKGSGFHPIYVFVDECQTLYAHGKGRDGRLIGGKKDDARAWRTVKALEDKARAVGIHICQATQRPDDRTLPAQVRESVHVRASLYVPKQSTAEMILGDAADRGARPQDLRPDKDKGVVVLAGEVEDIPTGSAFTIVRTHAVNDEEAAQVIARAVALRERRGITAEVEEEEQPPAAIDELADIATVMDGETRTMTTVILKRLYEHNRDHYGGWDFKRLKASLGAHEVEPYKSNGKMHVLLVDVEGAMEARAVAAARARMRAVDDAG